MTRIARRCLMLAVATTLAALLSGCDDGKVGVELSADPAATTANRQIGVSIEAITLQRDDGSEDRIKLDDPVTVDLLLYNGRTFTLLDAESLDAGDYTGIRLEYRNPQNDDGKDNYVIDGNGARQALIVDADDAFTPLDLTVKKKGKTYTLQLRIDLRLSYSENSNTDERHLAPVMRAVRDTKAAKVSGSVKDSLISGSDCKDGRNTGVGVTVYAFNKLAEGTEPHDYDGSEPRAIATTPITGSSGNWRYNLPLLPPGDYTLALTCNGDIEDPTELQSDEIEFLSDTHDVELGEGDDDDKDFN
ncbi:DUF4382 domain-containing protein [Hydrocarboniphaga sp.]|uniref:DUF4382 domain-containing protein n=1 Tax=Hydrocarboniphaga sp. TaxID=2033016 RepID=UPI003D0DF8CC